MSQAIEHRQPIHQLVDQLPAEALPDALLLLEELSHWIEQSEREMEWLNVIRRGLTPSQRGQWRVAAKVRSGTLTDRKHQELTPQGMGS